LPVHDLLVNTQGEVGMLDLHFVLSVKGKRRPS
jgi:hypothetical protein